jgi:3-hydroxyisobutyrate dehydrogenase
MSSVGFIGLGAMGLPMARNLLARGHAVCGFDTRKAAMDALVAAGGQQAATASAAARDAGMLILMVVNAAQAEQVLYADGALEALPPTCPPGTVEKLAARVLEAGRRFLDAPVSGGVVGATGATLTIMAAAPAGTFDAARPVLEALGNKIFHVGERPGQGAVVKTVNQLLCGVHIAVVAEALSLAGRVGVDPKVVLEILGGSSASSWMLNDRGPRMIEADPIVTSAVDIFVKDLGIVLEAGREAKAALPLAALAHQLFLATSGRGAGSADDSQVIRTYHAMNGGPLP